MVAFVHLPVPTHCLSVRLVSDASSYQHVQIRNNHLRCHRDLTSRFDSCPWHRNGCRSSWCHLVSKPQPDLSPSYTCSSSPCSSRCPRTSHRPCPSSHRACACRFWTRIWTALKTCQDYKMSNEY
nr:unnamed protein product [Callosobruchus chinensis]